MDVIIALIAFCSLVLCLLGTMRSLGLGLSCLLLVGYGYGIFRANFEGIFSSFVFDSGMLGVYISVFNSPKNKLQMSQFWKSSSGILIQCMMIWPLFLSLIPVDHALVQLVALRNDVLGGADDSDWLHAHGI